MKRKLYLLLVLFISLILITGITSIVFVNAEKDSSESILEIYNFPELEDFNNINVDFQSLDPKLYNFQMWADRDGLYFYAVQYTNPVKNSTNQWENTHVEFEIWNECFGYGWGGTYIALFLDGSMYFNNTKDVIGYHYEFNNFPVTGDIPYAYVKPYQCMPGVTPVNSQVVTRDGRTLITGDEKSFQVHSVIDAKMYT